MRKAHQILAGVLAALVVIQAMAIAYAFAGVFHWIDKDGGVLNSAVFNSWKDHHPTFRGAGGYGLHMVSGEMLIPLVTLILLIVSLFANKTLPGAAKRASILFLMVVVQVVLGLSAHDVVVLAPVHALNAFGIFAMSVSAARKASEASAPAAA